MVRHYTTEKEINPLPNPAVTGLYQDRLGYIWICAYGGGLVRYDGHKMEIYGAADSLPNAKTWLISEDGTGRLWAGTEGGVVVSAKALTDYAAGKRLAFLSKIGVTKLFDKGVSFGRQMTSDTEGRIWLATKADGIIRYRWQGNDLLAADTLRTAASGKEENQRVLSVEARKNGTICAAMKGTIVVCDLQAQWRDTLTASEGLPGAATGVLYEGPSGTLFGACADGTIWRLDEETSPAKIEIIHTGLKHPITALCETAEGNLWIATLGSGVVELDRSRAYQAKTYGSRNGLLGEVFWDVLEDREGNLWLAQNSGLSKLPFNFRAFQFYSAQSHPGQSPNLPASGVMAVLQTAMPSPENMLCAGTENGLALIAPGGKTETLNTESGLVSNIVFGVAEDRAHRVWITSRAGVYRSRMPLTAAAFKKWQTKAYKFSPLTLGKEVMSSVFVPVLPPGEQLPSLGMVWVDSLMWVAVDGGVLAVRPDPPKIVVRFSQKDSVVADGGFALNYSPLTRKLWLGTTDGLNEIDPASRKVLRTVSKQDGLVGDNCWGVSAISFADAGTVYYGTSNSLNLYRPEYDRDNAVPPAPQIRNAVFHEDEWGQNEILLEYAGLSYVNEKLVQYKTRLTGYDKNWSKETAENKIRYTNLPAFLFSKQYTFFYRLYEHVNRLCDATVFGVGIYHPDKQQIEYRLAIEKGKRYAPYTRNAGDKNQFPVWCIENRRPIFINDVAADYRRYLSEYKDPRRLLEDGTYSTAPQSLIYLPLLAQERVLGVITVQSYEKYAYTEYQLNLLQNLAAYTTIALDNADAYRRLHATLEHLKNTQQQLVTQEKLASLGQLTAGIAHEIKNPLNFVNNFASVSKELARELREEIEKRLPEIGKGDDFENLASILNDLERNAEKINHHGKRADSIVRSMLQLSRGKSGERELTDINALLDEAVNLTYHGFRAQESSFNLTIEKEYDPAIGKLEVVSQDLSRVFLNLLSNACYAVHQKAREGDGESGRKRDGVSGRPGKTEDPCHSVSHSPAQKFTPTLSVATENLGDQIEIRVRDNGNGIPADLRDMIFTPFFTTKPAGQGTGLGLSISYDIIVQQHGGEMKVQTDEGKFTEFVIRLARQSQASLRSL